MRKTLGFALTTVGVLLLLFVATVYARGALARDTARARWEAGEAERAMRASELDVAEVTISGADVRYARGAPIARLIIPSIGLDEIVVEGVGSSELNAGPGHLPGSALPGAAGNSVISAHRDRHFYGLDKVAIGDTITTQTGFDKAIWVVRSRKIVDASAPALRQTAQPALTLTTCWPVRFTGPAPDRLLLEAHLVVPPATRAERPNAS